jgi:hypothetical protein
LTLVHLRSNDQMWSEMEAELLPPSTKCKIKLLYSSCIKPPLVSRRSAAGARSSHRDYHCDGDETRGPEGWINEQRRGSRSSVRDASGCAGANGSSLARDPGGLSACHGAWCCGAGDEGCCAGSMSGCGGIKAAAEEATMVVMAGEAVGECSMGV